MASQELPRGLSRRRSSEVSNSDADKASFEVPDKFKDGLDADTDVTAPKSDLAKFMHQSLFSMIARAGLGPEAEYQSSLGDESTGSEAEDEGDSTRPRWRRRIHMAKTVAGLEDLPKDQRRSFPRRVISPPVQARLRTIRERTERSEDAAMSTSQILTPRSSSARLADPRPVEPHCAPEPHETIDASDVAEKSSMEAEPGLLQEDGTTRISVSIDQDDLAERLKEIFLFEEVEELIAEYPCWLLQSVLLEGYMYITQKHICFYSYLPRMKQDTVKSGYLFKGHKHRWGKYWFILKENVLSYYDDRADVYFPRRRINMRYAMSAKISDKKGNKDGTEFILATHDSTYHFKADSIASAKEWVRQLETVIFRSRNRGDTFKISLPVTNVIDIEENQMLDLADTVKLRVLDNDQTYSIDEYYFSFFSFGQEALHVLRSLTGDNALQTRPYNENPFILGESGQNHQAVNFAGQVSAAASRSPTSMKPSPLKFHGQGDVVYSSLLSPPLGPSSPKADSDSRRSSVEIPSSRQTWRGRSRGRSGSRSRSRSTSLLRRRRKSPSSPLRQESSDSVSNSLGPGTESSAAIQSIDDTNVSASQILRRSDIFHRPTLSRPSDVSLEVVADRPDRRSQDTARSPPGDRLGSDSPRTDESAAKQELKSSTDLADSGTQLEDLPSGSTSALQGLISAGAYPLQKASRLTNYLKSGSKRMSSLLATESMGYYEKVSGMWAGGRRHYNTVEGLETDDPALKGKIEEDGRNHELRFREHFALPESEHLHATFFGYLNRVLPLYGKIYIGSKHFCFRSMLPGTHTKLILPLGDIENVIKERAYKVHHYALVIVIRGHEEVFFEFSDVGIRDDCCVTLLQRLDAIQYLEQSQLLLQDDSIHIGAAEAEHRMLQRARQRSPPGAEFNPFHKPPKDDPNCQPIIFDDTHASIIDFKPSSPLRITFLTIGSRGDVQPFIALAKRLMEDGHTVRIATHAEFQPWIRKHGIDFRPVAGEPAELMRICIEHGMFTYSFMKEALSKYMDWLGELLETAWVACQDTDVLIEAPNAMAGIHIAEALQIPYFRAFSMPWTRTRAYPHAFAANGKKLGGTYNYYSYLIFDRMFWTGIAPKVNRWRRKTLGLGSTTLDKMQPNKVPFLYSFSPSVVIPPLDYSDWIHVTGYWFLDEGKNFEPPAALAEFIQKARYDGKKIVYFGFGSILVDDVAATTQTVIDAVLKADVRCILAKGWSDRLSKADAKPEPSLPPEIFLIQSCPHDWLFRQIDAAVHHGGAGTTGASLRAGIPTIIKPFFGDQFFYASRVEDMGVGTYLRSINVTTLARAMWEATNSERIRVKAKTLGEQIRKEDGVSTAVKMIYRDLEYARTLIKKPPTSVDGADALDDENIEESWTFIEDENDPELTKRFAEWDPAAGLDLGGLENLDRGQRMALGSVILQGVALGQNPLKMEKGKAT